MDRYHYHGIRSGGQSPLTEPRQLTKARRTGPSSYKSSIDAVRPLTRSRLTFAGVRKTSDSRASPNPSQSCHQEQCDIKGATLRPEMPRRITARGANHKPERPSRPKLPSERSYSRRNIHRPLDPLRGLELGDRYTQTAHPREIPIHAPGDIRRYLLDDRQSMSPTPVRRPAVPHRMSRPKIPQVRSHSRRARTAASCAINEPIPHLPTPGRLTEMYSEQVDNSLRRHLDIVQRANIRPSLPRKVTDHRRYSKPSRPQISARSHSRRYINARSNSYRSLESGDRGQEFAAPVHPTDRYTEISHQGRQYSQPDFSNLSEQPTEKDLDAFSRSLVTSAMSSWNRLERSRYIVDTDHYAEGYHSPRVHSSGFNQGEASQVEQGDDYLTAATKTQRIQARLDTAKWADIAQSSIEIPVRRSTRSVRAPPLSVHDKRSPPAKCEARWATTDFPIQRDASRTSFESSMTRTSSGKGTENEIVDLYAELDTDDSGTDVAYGEVEGRLHSIGPIITLDDMPDRLQNMLASIDLSQTAQSPKRQVSEACSVRSLDLHPDISRAVHTLRDGTSLNGFVLERIHSQNSSVA